MNGAQAQSPDPAAQITSSADRMVGMDHAEVRYFTRCGLNPSSPHLIDFANTVPAMIIMVNNQSLRLEFANGRDFKAFTKRCL